MRSTISVSLQNGEADRLRDLARRRGFPTVSTFIRYLIAECAGDPISEEEVLRRSKNADLLHKKGKLPKLASLADMIDA
jgi:hypothetical protein